jgi:hypothetical protein
MEVVKKRCYPKKQKRQETSRKGTVVYALTVHGEAVKICKQDKRGKHSSRPNKLSVESLQSVREHLNHIPKYQSHYSRNDNQNRVYFDCDMTISRLYTELYITWCAERGITPVLEYAYRKIFCTEYNIGFKIPKSDTCKTCDQLNIRIDSATQEKQNDVVTELTTQLK